MKIDNKKLDVAMANAGILLQDLARKANVSTETLRNIRKGTRVPRPTTIGKIARALNVNVQDIIED